MLGVCAMLKIKQEELIVIKICCKKEKKIKGKKIITMEVK